MEFLRAISFVASAGAVAALLFLTVIRLFFSPYGWTKKENEGVAVRFKVFLPLYLQKPEKWKLMPDKAEYDNMMTVYFSSGLEWRKYNRWQKKAEKERQKRQQEERKQQFMEAIFKDYQTEPNQEFTPPPTVKPKANKDKLTNAEIDKIRTDLLFSQYSPENIDTMIKQWADSKDWGINPMEVAVQAAIEKYQAEKPNPRCKDCKHMRYRHDCNGKIDTVCVKHKTACGFEPIFPAMVACGIFEPKTKTPTIKRPEPLGTVTTH